MKQNILIKLLASIPVILIFLYFIPFIGICLLILRLFLYSHKKVSTSVWLFMIGIVILSPILINKVLEILSIENFNIPYVSDFIQSDWYQDKWIGYSKLLISVSIIFLILSYVFQTLFRKMSSKLNNEFRNYIAREEQRSAEISQKNDLIMKEKRERAKNTHVVYCPHCGADNMLTESTGTCKYCRRKLEYKD